jgi:hypothetical protein
VYAGDVVGRPYRFHGGKITRREGAIIGGVGGPEFVFFHDRILRPSIAGRNPIDGL